MRKVNLFVGGLLDAGFDPSGKYLFVISTSGRGVFSTETWERLARDPADHYSLNGTGVGIGPIAGQIIPVTGKNFHTSVLEISSPDRKINLRYEDGTIEIWDEASSTQAHDG